MHSPLRLAVLDPENEVQDSNSDSPLSQEIVASVPSTAVRWTLRALCTVALCVSGYLAWTAFSATEVYGCTGDVFDCGHVLSSAWSKWFSVPVSVPAFALYASLLAVLAFTSPATPESLRKLAWQCLTAGGVSAAAAAIWFIALQVFVIKHLCPYCLVAHTCGLVVAGIVLFQQPLGRQLAAKWSVVGIAAALVLIGGQLLTPPPQTFIVEEFDVAPDTGAILDVATQDDEFFTAPGGDVFDAPGEFAPPDVFSAPGDVFEAPGDNVSETNGIVDPAVTNTGSDEPDESEDSQQDAAKIASSLLTIFPAAWSSAGYFVYASGDEKQSVADESAATVKDESAVRKRDSSTDSSNTSGAESSGEVATAPEPRIISVAGNKFRLNAAQWPMVGKPSARYIMVEMFDYTCPHCRNTHRTIKDTCRKYGDDLAIIVLAVPLNPSCNNAISSSGTHNADSCELAKLGVAVWRINPEVFSEYHNWMFDGGRNRTASEARQKAEQMVGREALQKEMSGKTPAAYIARHVELYKKVGSGAVPKMLFQTSMITGEVNNVAALSRYIDKGQ